MAHHLSESLFKAAKSIAAYHGHMWSWPEYARLFRPGMTADELGRLVRTAVAADPHQAELPGGLVAPTMIEGGVIIHTTSSGRAQWRLWENEAGIQCRLTVSRPDGPVLEVGEGGLHVMGAFGTRHVFAMRDMVVPLAAHCAWAEEALPLLEGLEAQAREFDAAEAA